MKVFMFVLFPYLFSFFIIIPLHTMRMVLCLSRFLSERKAIPQRSNAYFPYISRRVPKRIDNFNVVKGFVAFRGYKLRT